MCPPVIAAVGIAATIASTAVSVYGAQQQGKAQAGQATYQAAVARNNQVAAGYAATDAAKRGVSAEDRQRERTAGLLGTQRAALGAQGTTLSGSALDILGDTAGAGEADALTIRSNAAREVYGIRNQQMNLGAQAGLLDSAAGNARTAGMIGAGSSLLAGASSVADKWQVWQQRQGAGL